jgi:hypothetical protein
MGQSRIPVLTQALRRMISRVSRPQRRQSADSFTQSEVIKNVLYVKHALTSRDRSLLCSIVQPLRVVFMVCSQSVSMSSARIILLHLVSVSRSVEEFLSTRGSVCVEASACCRTCVAACGMVDRIARIIGSVCVAACGMVREKAVLFMGLHTQSSCF